MTHASFARFLAPLAFGVAGVELAGIALADDAKPAATPAAATASAVSSCVLKGSQAAPKGTQIYDASTGGRVVAELTGAIVPLQISELPADPTTGRAKIATSNGSATVRIDGFAAPTSFSVYSVKDVPIASGHVWIADGQKVKLTGAQASTLTAEITIAGSQNQAAKGTAACDAFALEKGTVTSFTVPGNGRGYQMKSTSLDLYDDANGTSVFSLSMLEGTGQLFWSTESKAGFVHVQMRGDIVVDAWAKWSALNPLKKGEMLDQAIGGTTGVGGAQLTFDKTPTMLTAAKDIPIRARRDEKEKTIGTIESGAEFYVMETIVGWANILPKHLGFTAPTDGGFWVLSADLPKS